jgi:hypothetical protein
LITPGLRTYLFEGPLQRAREAVHHLPGLRPALELLHVAEPALDVRIGGEVRANDAAGRDERRPVVVGERDLVAAQVLVLADDVVVEHLEPAGGALLRPRERALLVLVARALVVREGLRVDQAVAEVAVELGVDPVDALVDPRALLQSLRV